MPRKKLDLDKLLGKIVALMPRHQPKDLTFSQISRLCGVPRSTLYYYFGSSVNNMIEEAGRYGMSLFTQVYEINEDESISSWEEFTRLRLKRSLELIQKYPWSPALYFRYRNDAGDIGQMIRGVEKTYLDKIGRVWEKYHPGEKKSLHGIHLATYLKLGLFFGFANEGKFWLEKGREDRMDKVLDYMTKVVLESMALDIR